MTINFDSFVNEVDQEELSEIINHLFSKRNGLQADIFTLVATNEKLAYVEQKIGGQIRSSHHKLIKEVVHSQNSHSDLVRKAVNKMSEYAMLCLYGGFTYTDHETDEPITVSTNIPQENFIQSRDYPNGELVVEGAVEAVMYINLSECKFNEEGTQFCFSFFPAVETPRHIKVYSPPDVYMTENGSLVETK